MRSSFARHEEARSKHESLFGTKMTECDLSSANGSIVAVAFPDTSFAIVSTLFPFRISHVR